MSDFNEILQKQIKKEVKKTVSETLQPLEILRGYDSELFTLEEISEIFREDKTIIRDAAKRGEIPAQFYGRQVRFPRYLIVQYLMGTWKPAKKKKERSNMNPNVLSLQEKINNFVS